MFNVKYPTNAQYNIVCENVTHEKIKHEKIKGTTPHGLCDHP